MKNVPENELFSAYLDGELTAAEQAEVERMLAASPAARQLLDELRALSINLQSLPVHKLSVDLGPSVLRAAERRLLAGPGGTDASISPTASGSIWRSTLRRLARPRNLLWPAVAAAAAVVMVLSNPPERRGGHEGREFEVAMARPGDSKEGESKELVGPTTIGPAPGSAPPLSALAIHEEAETLQPKAGEPSAPAVSFGAHADRPADASGLDLMMIRRSDSAEAKADAKLPARPTDVRRGEVAAQARKAPAEKAPSAPDGMPSAAREEESHAYFDRASKDSAQPSEKTAAGGRFMDKAPLPGKAGQIAEAEHPSENAPKQSLKRLEKIAGTGEAAGETTQRALGEELAEPQSTPMPLAKSEASPRGRASMKMKEAQSDAPAGPASQALGKAAMRDGSQEVQDQAKSAQYGFNGVQPVLVVECDVTQEALDQDLLKQVLLKNSIAVPESRGARLAEQTDKAAANRVEVEATATQLQGAIGDLQARPEAFLAVAAPPELQPAQTVPQPSQEALNANKQAPPATAPLSAAASPAAQAGVAVQMAPKTGQATMQVKVQISPQGGRASPAATATLGDTAPALMQGQKIEIRAGGGVAQDATRGLQSATRGLKVEVMPRSPALRAAGALGGAGNQGNIAGQAQTAAQPETQRPKAASTPDSSGQAEGLPAARQRVLFVLNLVGPGQQQTGATAKEAMPALDAEAGRKQAPVPAASKPPAK